MSKKKNVTTKRGSETYSATRDHVEIYLADIRGKHNRDVARLAMVDALCEEDMFDVLDSVVIALESEPCTEALGNAIQKQVREYLMSR